MAVDAAPTWMTPIWDFLINGTLPHDKVQARQIQSRATRYTILDHKLYKRGFSLPLLLCITPDKGLEALREIHEGICRDHAAAQTMAHKVLHRGYFWPTIKANAKLFANLPHQPPERLTPITRPWPFAQ